MNITNLSFMNVNNVSFRMLLLAILFMLFSCGEKEVAYVNYEVNFFKDSPYFIYTGPQWETISEEVLVREAHNEGATLVQKELEVLNREGYTRKEVGTESTIEIEIDLELNTIQRIQCTDFFQVVELVDVIIPDSYTTITIQEVLVNGTGADVPAQYMTRTYNRLVTDAKYEPIANTNPISNTFTFRLPSDMSIVDYIQDYYMDKDQADCIESVSFSVQ